MSAGYQPYPVQQEFHALTTDEALFGGAAGPGKSLVLLMDANEQVLVEHNRWLKDPNNFRSVGWAIHFRREFTRLEQTIARSHRLFPMLDAGCDYDSQHHTWIFSSGYRYAFGHMAGKNDYLNYGSNEYTWIGFDELTEFTEEQYMFMGTRLRTGDPILRKMLKRRAGTNPISPPENPEGLLWVRKYFVDPAPDGRKILTKRVWVESTATWEKRTRIYIPALLRDNLTPGFREQYELELSDKPAHIREALLNANWYVVANAFYSDEWQSDVHVYDPKKLFPKGIPSGWHRFRSMDWGYKSPCVILDWAVDTDGNLYCYREQNFRKKTADKVALALVEIDQANGDWDFHNNRSKLRGPADNQIKEQRGTIGETIRETFQRYGIFWDMATKNRPASVEQFRQRLTSRSGENNDIPAIRFSKVCKKTIQTIPAIPTDPGNLELPMDGGEDHWLDTVHYAVMCRPFVPDSDEAPLKTYDDELSEFRERKRKRRAGGVSWGYGR